MNTTPALITNAGVYNSFNFPGYWGSPLILGGGNCIPGNGASDCSWTFVFYSYTSGSRDTDGYYAGGLLTDLNNFPNLTWGSYSLANNNTVVRSLDVVPANNAFMMASISSPSVAGFTPSLQHMPVSNLQDFATGEGLQGRVISAVSPDSPTSAYVISYGWSGDPASIYEATVEQVTTDTIGTVAQNLASQGYVLTAFGGNPTDGFLLVGTRLAGSDTARGLVVAPGNVSVDQYYAEGYVDVALFSDSSDDITSIIEK